MRRRVLLVTCMLGATVAFDGVAVAAPLPAFTTAPKTRVAPPSTAATLVSVNVGRHATFDRIVFRFRGSTTPGWSVRYVPEVTRDGSGFPVALLGTRYLQIVVQPATGRGSRIPATLTPRFPTLRQLKAAGDFEAVLTFGAGLSKRAGFRVFQLSSPRRIVIDVAH